MENSIQIKNLNVAEVSLAVSSKCLTGSTQISQFEPSDTASNAERFQRRAQKLKVTLAEIQQNALDSVNEMKELRTKLQIQFEHLEKHFKSQY